MKAKELADLLMQNPEFEVKCVFADTSECSAEHLYPDYHFMKVSDIADVEYSNKVIVLDTE